jgi:putative tryptophan/tyrosine transport system substrate-binding protein
MRRRQFITLLGGFGAAWPLAARAQQSSNKVPVVGVLWHAGSAEEEDVYLSVLVKAFNDLGYIEGKNIHLDQRFPAENPERFQKLGQELIDDHPAVLMAITSFGAVTLKKLTGSIPIVFVFVPDPLGFGLVNSLARPGGNATGPSLMAVDLSGKRLELLKQVVPGLSRVALLTDPKTDPSRERTIKNHQAAAEALGVTLWNEDIAGPEDVEPVFAKIADNHADGVVRGTSGGLFFNLRARIGAAALAHKLPVCNGLHCGGSAVWLPHVIRAGLTRFCPPRGGLRR